MGIKNPIQAVADPAIVLRPNPTPDTAPGEPYVIFSPRKWFHYNSSFLPVRWQKSSPQATAEFTRLLRLLSGLSDWIIEQYGLNILFVPMYPGLEQGDERVCRLLIENIKHSNKTAVLDTAGRTHQMLDHYGRARFAVTIRMHSAILATCAGIPSIGIYYQDKGLSFFEAIEMCDFAFPIKQANFEAIASGVSKLMANSREYQDHICRRREELTQKAHQAGEILSTIL
jgi:polysaccharide pyruvyl transferase WcaK-like protein